MTAQMATMLSSGWRIMAISHQKVCGNILGTRNPLAIGNDTESQWVRLFYCQS